MARQYKKILKKIKPKEDKPKEKPEKIGKDYILIIVFSITFFFMVIGWTYFEPLNRGLYLALTIALGTTYIRRHMELGEKSKFWVEKISQIAIGIAIVLFAILAYYQHFSD